MRHWIVMALGLFAMPLSAQQPMTAEQQAQEDKERAARWEAADRKRQERNTVSEWLSHPEPTKPTTSADQIKIGAFDTEAHCKHIGAIPKGGSYVIEQGCRDQERQAQAKLQAMQIPPEIVEHCTHIGSVPVGGSYTIMLGCVEQEIQAKANLH